MLCPFCLNTVKSKTQSCDSCQQELPSDYVDHHRGWLSHFNAPAMVSVIGFKGHGKTVYLASLFYALQNMVQHAWSDFYRQALTIESLRVLYENLRLLKIGEMPDSTQGVFPTPNIDRLSYIPKFGNRTLLMYDPPGEAFNLDEADSMERFAGFVKYSPCALFLVSLTDMMDQFETMEAVADNMHRLLERYNVGLSGSQIRQHLIVVYTKADRLLSQPGFPPEVIQCLETSGVDGLGNISKYLQDMKRNSVLLRDFTINTLNARNFLNNAQAHFKSVEFCAVSALGSEPSGKRLAERITPRRVLDPLIWVLKKSPKNVFQRVFT